MDWLTIVHGAAAQTPPANFGPGDEVRVWYRILEQGKERLGQFEGVVIRYRGAGSSKTFTVRRVTHGEGVERVFPVDSKTVSRIEVLRKGKVKRSRLYFLRRVIGKTRIAEADRSTGMESVAARVQTGKQPADAQSSTEKTESPLAAAEPAADHVTPHT